MIKLIVAGNKTKEDKAIDISTMGAPYVNVRIGEEIVIADNDGNHQYRLVDVRHIFEQYVTRGGHQQDFYVQAKTIYYVEET